MKFAAGVIAALSLFTITGCAHTVDVTKFQETALDQKVADILPPQYVIDKKQPKIAVLPLGEPARYTGKLSSGAQEALTQLVSKTCGMEVVERSQAQKLFDEKKFVWSLDLGADMSGLMKMAQGIDYVVLGSITNPSVGAEFHPSQTSCDKKGRCSTSEPYCSTSGNATVNIRIVNSTTGSIAQSFEPFKGSSGNSYRTSYASQCKVENPTELVNSAVADAIKRAKKPFVEAFPRYGYLYKTMTGPDGKRIAYVNLGKLDGVKPGDDVELIKYVKEVDRIRKKSRLTTQKIADVKIAETDLQDDRSIIIIPGDYSSQIMPGLAVKTKYNSSFFGSLFE